MRAPYKAMAAVAVFAAAVFSSAGGALGAGLFGSDYVEIGRCGPFARVAVRTPPWACVGIVAGGTHGLEHPRLIIEAAPGRFIITDMFGWGDDGARGRVLALDVAADGSAKISTLFAKLTMPHGLALGPDGLVYVGEPNRIWRFDPKSENPNQDIVLADLPANADDDQHPLKNFAFDQTGALILSVGAPSDRCETERGKDATVQFPCLITDEGDRPRAALWRVTFDRPGGQVAKVEVLARGLRNSMALAVHLRSGLILQGENSLDIFDSNLSRDPPDELNVIEPGRHYGWPYCYSATRLVPAYQGHNIDCGRFSRPAVMLAPHSAPLGMVYYNGDMFPELRGKLIVGFHSLNPHPGNGHRIAVYDTDDAGVPLQPPTRQRGFGTMLVDDWGEGSPLRPAGTPVGLTVAGDGSIWFAEDINETVMVMLRTAP